MLLLYTLTPKTKLTAAQMLQVARNMKAHIVTQAGHIFNSLHMGLVTPKSFTMLSDIC